MPDATYVSLTEIQLDLRHAQNLKEKRKVVSSLKAQIRQRFVAAVAEIDAHDDRRRAVLLCALVGGAEVRERADRAGALRRGALSGRVRVRARPADPRRPARMRRSDAPVMLARVWPVATACAESTRSCAR